MLDFQVKDTRTQRNSTSIRLNAETLEIKGTQESLGDFQIENYCNEILTISILVYNTEALVVSVGSFLGLFIGLSLNDVLSLMFDLISSFYKRYTKKK